MISYAQAEKLVLMVFSERGQPNVKDDTQLSAIGYTQTINLYHLIATINQAIIDEYGKQHALKSSVTTGWKSVLDVVKSVEQA